MVIYTVENIDEVWKLIKSDPYATNDVWDLEKVQIVPVSVVVVTPYIKHFPFQWRVHQLIEHAVRLGCERAPEQVNHLEQLHLLKDEAIPELEEDHVGHQLSSMWWARESLNLRQPAKSMLASRQRRRIQVDSPPAR